MAGLAENFARLHADFDAALLACRADTDEKSVHRLRKLTRMIEALLLKALEDHPGANDLQHAIAKVAKELKRVRRAAGPVRDLDVHRRMAAEVCASAVKSGAGNLREQISQSCERLDRRLQKRREHCTRELRDLLKQRELMIERKLGKLAEAVAGLRSNDPAALTTARAWIARTPKPTLDTESLHGFRKKTKAARYLTAMQTDASAKKLEKRLKSTQDDIGKWHDLLLLTREAKHGLGKKAAFARAIKVERDRAMNAVTHKLQLTT